MKKSSVALKSNCKRTLLNWLPFVYRGKTELGKRIACALLGVALAVGGANAWGEDLTFNPAKDITINMGDTLTVNNFNVEGNDPSKTITLNGGKLNINIDAYAMDGIIGMPTNNYVMYNNQEVPFTTDNSLHNFSIGSEGGAIEVSGEYEYQYFSFNQGINTDGNLTISTNNSSGHMSIGFQPNMSKAVFSYPEFQILTQTYQDENVFNGTVDINNKVNNTNSISFWGNNHFNNTVTVSKNELLLSYGQTVFEESVTITNGGFSGSNNSNVTFNKEVVISNTNWYSLGNSNGNSIVCSGGLTLKENSSFRTGPDTQLTINGKISIDNSSDYFVGNTVEYGNSSFIELMGRCESLARNLNTKVVSSDGSIAYSNTTYNTSVNAIAHNAVYITYNENMNPTAIECDTSINNILNAAEEKDIITQEISGKGSIYVYTYAQKENDITASLNSYTLLFKGNNLQNFIGSFLVSSGNTVVCGNSVLGSDDIDFTVANENYEKAKLNDGTDAWKMLTNGQLSFYRGDKYDASIAPEVKCRTITFLGKGENNDEHCSDGARLWLDSSLGTSTGKIDNTSSRLVGVITAKEEISLGEDLQVWWDKISTVASKDSNGQLVNVTFKMNAPSIQYDGLNVSNPEAKPLDKLFSSELITATVDIEHFKSVTITANVKDAKSYASENKLDSYAIKGAQQIDNIRLAISNVTPFLDALYNEDDAQKVQQTFHNIGISNGLTNAVNQTHLGSAGSQFFGGAMADATSSVTTRGQSKDNSNALRGGCGLGAALDGWTVWATPSYTSIKADGYVDQGLTKDGYRVNRAGFLAGMRRQFDEKTSGGFIFAYSGPEMDQAGAYEGWGTSYKTEIEMSDYQVAMHLEHVFCEKWEASLFLGTGAQYLDWDRSLYVMNEGAYNYKGDTKGNTFTFTAYLARPIEINDHFVLRPTIGLDSEHSWLYGFDESGTDESAGGYASVATQRMHYDKIGYSRNMARIGLVAGVTSDNNRLGMSGRLFYGVALGGDDAASVHTVGLGDGFDFGNVEGYAMGDESLNLGYGLFYYLNEAKTLSASADYNAILYKNATTQNVTAGIQYKF